MIVIRCPYCAELRTEEELSHGGEVGPDRPPMPEASSDAEWTDYLFMRVNPKGIVKEHWCCTFGCGQWFRVSRDTVTHVVHDVSRLEPAGATAPHAARCERKS